MTWIDDVQTKIKKQYKIAPLIAENYKTRYKHYHNRAGFRLVLDDKNFEETSYWRNHDWGKFHQLKAALTSKLGNNIKLRNEWFETFVYFKDLDAFLAAIPKNLIPYLSSLELMNPCAIVAKENFVHDYPVDLVVKPRLPFDKYRYRIYTATNGKVRNSIGQENLLSIYGSIKAYDGIYVPQRFERYVERSWNPDTYFYSETLDWLPLIYMMDPRYIKRIEQFKTTKELEENDATA